MTSHMTSHSRRFTVGSVFTWSHEGHYITEPGEVHIGERPWITLFIAHVWGDLGEPFPVTVQCSKTVRRVEEHYGKPSCKMRRGVLRAMSHAKQWPASKSRCCLRASDYTVVSRLQQGIVSQSRHQAPIPTFPSSMGKKAAASASGGKSKAAPKAVAKSRQLPRGPRRRTRSPPRHRRQRPPSRKPLQLSPRRRSPVPAGRSRLRNQWRSVPSNGSRCGVLWGCL